MDIKSKPLFIFGDLLTGADASPSVDRLATVAKGVTIQNRPGMF